MKGFFPYIKFQYIPCDVIIKEIYPLKVVPNFIIIRALAHQADPLFEDFPISEDQLLSPTYSSKKIVCIYILFYCKNHFILFYHFIWKVDKEGN